MTTIKKYAIIAGVLFATHTLAFALGRYLTPEKVIERESVRVVEVEKQVVVVQEKVKIEYVKDTSQQQAIHREEHKTEHPNGLVETHKSEDINTTTVIKEHDIQYVDRVVEKETVKYQDRVVEKEKIVEAPKPNWRLGPIVGYDVARFEAANPWAGFSYGATVERRILGPVSAGAWGLSSGSFGLSLTLEF